MRYVSAKLRQESDIRTYRFFVTDALKMITENQAGLENKVRYITQRYSDTISNQPEQEEDPRSCVEIVADMWAKINGKEVSNG